MVVRECAEYKLTVEVFADKILDLEQLLCLIAEKILYGAATGHGRGRTGSYSFNLEKIKEVKA